MVAVAPMGADFISRFLNEHPEEIKTKKPLGHSVSTGRDVYYHSPEAFQIANNKIDRVFIVQPF